MVEVFGLPPAVLTPMAVTLEHRPAIDGYPALIRDAHIAAEADHGR
jgi:hypothetical protein